MIKIILFFTCLSNAFIESSEFKGNEESKFLIALEKSITAFLPYNPNILEIGGQEGAATKWLANQFPKGTLIVFESDKKKIMKLKTNLKKFTNVFVFNSPLKSVNKNSKKIDLTLDQWCNLNKIPSFDLIRLDFDENNLSTLKGASEILKTTSVISIKLDNSFSTSKLTRIGYLNKTLEKYKFILFPSEHQIKMGNELVFIRQDIYDCIFK